MKDLSLKRNIERFENLIYDLYYQKEYLGWTKHSPYAALGSHDTAPTSYLKLKEIFRHVNLNRSNVLVDVGCGTGRVINYWLSQGFKNKLYGIELDDEVAQRTKTNLKRFRNVEIISGSILDNIPPDADVFYLFNPFNGIIMQQFIDALIQAFPRKEVTIIYNNANYLDLYRNNPKFRIEKEFLLNYSTYSHKAAVILLNPGK